jgi:hypothetical protein
LLEGTLLEKRRLAGEKLLFALLFLNLPDLLLGHAAGKGIALGLRRLILLLQDLLGGERLRRHGKGGQKAKTGKGGKQNFHGYNV